MGLSSFLNGRAPVQLRGLQWLAFSDTGVTLRGTVTDDSGGGGTTTFAAVGTAACRIDPLTPNSRITGGQIDERSTHLVTIPIGGTVRSSDRFAISGRGTFEVTAVYELTSELAHVFEVIGIT
jgi:hypothetical protein